MNKSPSGKSGTVQIDPHVWLANTLTAIVKGHKQSQIDDLLPWNYAVMV